MASTGTVRPIQGHHDVAKLCSAEGAAVDQFVPMDDPPANSCSERQSLKWLCAPKRKLSAASSVYQASEREVLCGACFLKQLKLYQAPKHPESFWMEMFS